MIEKTLLTAVALALERRQVIDWLRHVTQKGVEIHSVATGR